MAIFASSDLPATVRSALGEMLTVVVDGLNAKAARVAPCLVAVAPATPPTADQLAEARFVLVGAVKRMADAGSGAVQSQTAGPYSMTLDTRQRPGYNLWPSEIEQLQAICRAGTNPRRAFAVDTATTSVTHLDWCSLNLGATYCSCGADLAGYPIFEEY